VEKESEYNKSRKMNHESRQSNYGKIENIVLQDQLTSKERKESHNQNSSRPKTKVRDHD
jgi:hypothetical protein